MKKFLVLLVLGCSQLLFAQETVYFPAFETINVNHKHQYVTSKLFKNYVDAKGEYTIILPEGLNQHSDQAYTESLEETKAKALMNKASYYLLSDMSAIGDLLIINMRMYNASSGQMVWSDALKADELEDLDPVIQLFANAIGTDQPAVNAGDIYSVTQYDSRELNRREANKSWGFSIGGGSILSERADEGGVSGFGILLSYDVRDLILDVKGELSWGKSANAQRIGLNLLKPINNKNLTLFYGGGIYYGGMTYDAEPRYETHPHYGYTYWEEHRGSGIELEGNFGVIFNRLSSMQLRATITPIIATYTIEDNAVGAIRLGVTATF